jgi:threonine dehydrogenase-like Zn-dependent dehydrogenase
MKALVVASPGSVSLVQYDEPTAAEGEIIVAPQVVGMCGTDLELIDGGIDPAYVRYPLVLGHEWVGVLEADVVGVAAAGERVVVEGVIPCGACTECRRDDTNRCVTYDEIGFTRPGAIAERIAVPSRLVHRIEPSVDPFDAVLVEPMAVVWRALTRFALRQGLRVAVVGDGTIALLTAHMVRLFEPTEVVVVGRREAQANLATRAGADTFTTTAPEGRFDLVIEAAGSASSAATSVALAERGGTVILLGLPAHGTVIELAPDDVVNNDLVIQGSFSYTQLSWAQVVHRVNAGELRPSFLVTHRYGLEEAVEALSALRGNVRESEPRGKVVITL